MSIHNFTFHRKYYMQICNTEECREMERMRVRTDLALEARESFEGSEEEACFFHSSKCLEEKYDFHNRNKKILIGICVHIK